MDCSTGETTAGGRLVIKNILQCDDKQELANLKVWVQSYVPSESRAAQDDEMLQKCIVNSSTSDGL